MRLMGWDFDIVHCTNNCLVDADYWLQLDKDLCYDPLFREYLHIVLELRWAHPPPTDLPMKVENMLYYCGPCIPIEHCPSGTSTDEADVDVNANTLMTTIVTQGDIGHTSLCIRPFQVGTFVSMPPGT